MNGVGVRMVGDDGEDYLGWVFDEDGTLRRAKRLAERGDLDPFDGVSVPLVAEDIAELEWAVELQRRCDRHYQCAEAVQALEDADERRAMLALGASESQAAECLQRDLSSGPVARGRIAESLGVLPCERSGGVGSAGLVSVLSKEKRASRKKVRAPFRVRAEQAESFKARGVFVAGGDDARMARLRRAVGSAARFHSAARKGHRPDECRMVTFTYADADSWEPQQIKACMDHFRKWHNRNGMKCRYVWIAELQDGKRLNGHGLGRMAVHYHALFWVPVGAPHFPKADLQGWWKHGSTRTEKAEKAAAYICSYLKKSDSKHFVEFPDGCRLYSVGGLDHAMRRARRWLGLPGFVQANSDIHDEWKRAPRGWGGWIDPHGVHWPSEFQRVGVGVPGYIGLERVHTHPRVIEASGPFSWLPVCE